MTSGLENLQNRTKGLPIAQFASKNEFYETDKKSKVIKYKGSVTQWTGECWEIVCPSDGHKECAKVRELIKMIRDTKKFQAQQFEEVPRAVIGTEIIKEFFNKDGELEKFYGQVTEKMVHNAWMWVP